MIAVSEFDQYNIETLPEDLLRGILAQVSFHDRLVVMPLVSSDWAKALAGESIVWDHLELNQPPQDWSKLTCWAAKHFEPHIHKSTPRRREEPCRNSLARHPLRSRQEGMQPSTLDQPRSDSTTEGDAYYPEGKSSYEAAGEKVGDSLQAAKQKILG
ncbi:hypothetical protein WJX77_009157 [Trebouxia sp. C0004]